LFIEALEGSQAKGVAEKKHALARIKRERDDPWAASGRDVQFSLILNIRYQFAETVKRDLQSPLPVLRFKICLLQRDILHATRSRRRRGVSYRRVPIDLSDVY
jgi:hypothetical protein